MAIGDDAAAQGYEVVPGSGEAGKVKYGAREINRTRDYLARFVQWCITNLSPKVHKHDISDLTADGQSVTSSSTSANLVRYILNIQTSDGPPNNADGRPNGNIYLHYL